MAESSNNNNDSTVTESLTSKARGRMREVEDRADAQKNKHNTSKEKRSKDLSTVSRKLSSQTDIQAVPKMHDPSWDKYIPDTEKYNKGMFDFIQGFKKFSNTFTRAYRRIIQIESKEEKAIRDINSVRFPLLESSVEEMGIEISKGFEHAMRPFEMLNPAIGRIVEHGKNLEKQYEKDHDVNKQQLIYLKSIGKLNEEEFNFALRKEQNDFRQKILEMRSSRDSAIEKINEQTFFLTQKANEDRVKFGKALLRSWSEFTYRNWGTLHSLDRNLSVFFNFYYKTIKQKTAERRERKRENLTGWKAFRHWFSKEAREERKLRWRMFTLQTFWLRRILMRIHAVWAIAKFIPITIPKYILKSAWFITKPLLSMGKSLTILALKTPLIHNAIEKVIRGTARIWDIIKTSSKGMARDIGKWLGNKFTSLKDTIKQGFRRLRMSNLLGALGRGAGGLLSGKGGLLGLLLGGGLWGMSEITSNDNLKKRVYEGMESIRNRMELSTTNIISSILEMVGIEEKAAEKSGAGFSKLLNGTFGSIFSGMVKYTFNHYKRIRSWFDADFAKTVDTEKLEQELKGILNDILIKPLDAIGLFFYSIFNGLDSTNPETVQRWEEAKDKIFIPLKNLWNSTVDIAERIGQWFSDMTQKIKDKWNSWVQDVPFLSSLQFSDSEKENPSTVSTPLALPKEKDTKISNPLALPKEEDTKSVEKSSWWNSFSNKISRMVGLGETKTLATVERTVQKFDQLADDITVKFDTLKLNTIEYAQQTKNKTMQFIDPKIVEARSAIREFGGKGTDVYFGTKKMIETELIPPMLEGFDLIKKETVNSWEELQQGYERGKSVGERQQKIENPLRGTIFGQAPISMTNDSRKRDIQQIQLTNAIASNSTRNTNLGTSSTNNINNVTFLQNVSPRDASGLHFNNPMFG